jgi:pimeloyl-ACP methyl ester carboxylesterase
MVHATRLPEGTLHSWAAGIDLRVVAVAVGMAIIIGDLLWRRRSTTPIPAIAAEAPANHLTKSLPERVTREARQEEATASSGDTAGPPLTISYCRTPDGVRLAYAKIGQGPVLVRAGHWFSHLQLEWEDSGRRQALQRLGKGRTLVCYDARGSGLSDWEVDDISLASWVIDLETVVEAAGLDRFALYGSSQTTSVAIAYAARHPERVTKLILYGGYAQGWKHRPGANVEQQRAMLTLMRLGWEQENPAFRMMFTSQFMPDASKQEFDAFTELGSKCTSAECASRYLEATGDTDVSDLLAHVTAPTLVGHVRGDTRTPFESGRQLAAGIPGAHFVALPGRNHILLPGDPARERWFEEMEQFLRD